MNCPMIEVFPTLPLDIPLDFLSVIKGSSFDGIKIVDIASVREWDREEFSGNFLVVA